MTDYTKLRELAQHATPGPYHIDYIESGEHGLFIDEDRAETAQLGCGGTEVAGFLTKANAEFIAAANPAVVLALLDELQRTRELADRLRERGAALTEEVQRLTVENLKLRMNQGEA